ncbi:ATP-dependent zinc metalloprotease FtsH [Faecousia sp.]|uniref:ATP-dependent zinc metalloprotease FtsH n=1 Tax=Faecousia sp. TaxID=2952921 RepID=UPI003AF62A43
MANQSPQNRPNGNNNNDNRNGDRRRFSILTILIIAVAVTLLFNSLLSNVFSAGEKQVTYDAFLSAVETDAISQVEIQSDRIQFLRRDEMALSKSQRTVYYTGLLPNVDLTSLISTLEDNQVEFSGEIVENSTFTFLFSWVLFPLLMLALLSLLMRFIISRSGGGAGGFGAIGSIGKSKAKVYMEKETGVTFRDVAGQDEAKESLVEIIDFLHNPQKYAAIGAKLPKGALLVGSPGTGKTLLAKAVAGEARVPFFSISGSDFVEMFVGVGASRVRDLFQEASKVAPAIIFIDEIDAIGRSRDSRLGGNDEREQTLNQLLAEIDGFDSSKGVVILAATNRPEILDKALLRAGRFDRRIIVDRPNLEGRYQTLLVHTRNIRLAEDVDLKKIAQATAGAVGADLANLVNEAALRAVRMGRQTVNQEDLLTSFEVVIAGTEKKGTVLTDIEKRIVAYHEVGHALVAALQKHTQPVSKITIVPHTSGALGYTMQMPEEEKYLNSRDELLVELRTMLGGRAAEQTVFGIETTGASNDIERATDLARKMVMQYGMSDRIGLMALTTKGNEYLDGQSYTDCAQTTAAAADEEVRKLLNDSYDQAKKILTENRGLLDEVALYLLQKETITGDELMQYVDADKRLRGSKQETLPEAEP